ncbi:GNAT family N-acetyltransferase, partial [Bacillus cereus]|uniref:GNAT family N-acetyltransferase n=1 Tax=Bacillus cereus TaxID=1396 RepID=UPI002850A8B5
SDEKMKYLIKNTHLFVSEEEGEVIGFANFSPVRLQNEAELGVIYLLPDQQGKGIGSALLQIGIKALNGIRKFYIHVE